ncbi:MAG: hypothetical protein HZA51_16675 [Planctomycetes bacterium]|nr:hypothetical protein [Planctomycetota bacterium]
MFHDISSRAAFAFALCTAAAFAEPTTDSALPAHRSLDLKINLTLARAPLSAALHDIATRSGLNLVIDWPALRDARIAGDIPVTLSLQAVPARTALDAVLQSVRRPGATLVHMIEGDVVRITTELALSREIETRVYRCTDLLPTALTDSERGDLESAVTRFWRSNFAVFAPPWRYPRTKVGPREEAGAIADDLKRSLSARRMEQIAGAVHNVGARTSWQEFGGLGSVTIVGDTLVVTQSLDQHLRIESLLAQLRHRLPTAKATR